MVKVASLRSGGADWSPVSPTLSLITSDCCSCASHSPTTKPHRELVLSEWFSFLDIVAQKGEIALNGNTLDIPSVVAIARWVPLCCISVLGEGN
jgi:hypothetical protein